MIRLLEELALNAWPALQTTYRDGWVLRFADGYTRRANSVQPLYEPAEEPRRKIAYCERVYRSRGQATVFKITPAAQPVDLDEILESRGYAKQALTSVQALDLTDFEPARSDQVTLEPTPSEEWLAGFARLSGLDNRNIPVMTQMLRSIIPLAGFATLRRDAEAVAMGLAVVERGHIGLFDIVTASLERNRGYGRQLVSHLLHWGKDNGAEQAYLQVMCNNAPALHLYAGLGFRERYQYWYRVH